MSVFLPRQFEKTVTQSRRRGLHVQAEVAVRRQAEKVGEILLRADGVVEQTSDLEDRIALFYERLRGNVFGSVFEAAGRRRGADQKAACFLGIANERSEQTEVVFGKLITEHPDRCRKIPLGR